MKALARIVGFGPEEEEPRDDGAKVAEQTARADAAENVLHDRLASLRSRLRENEG